MRPPLSHYRKVFMRREKVLVIGDKNYTVRELKSSDVIRLSETGEGLQKLNQLSLGLSGASRDILRLCMDLPAKEFDALTEGINAFSQLEAAMREVNSDFFEALPGRIEALTATTNRIAQHSKSAASS